MAKGAVHKKGRIPATPGELMSKMIIVNLIMIFVIGILVPSAMSEVHIDERYLLLQDFAIKLFIVNLVLIDLVEVASVLKMLKNP